MPPEKVNEPVLGKSLVFYQDGDILCVAPFPMEPESLNGHCKQGEIRVFLPYQRSLTLAHMASGTDYMGERTYMACEAAEAERIIGTYNYLWGRNNLPEGAREEVLFLAEKATGNDKLKDRIGTIRFCRVSFQLDMEF